jgi:hypothetical protein
LAERTEKLCRGPLHRGGVMLPIYEFGPTRTGVLSQCRACRRHYLGREPDSGLVPYETAKSVIDKLAEQFGGITKVAVALGLQRNSFSRRHKAIKRKTFQRAVELLAEVEHEKKFKVGEAEVVRCEILSPYLLRWQEKFLAEYHPDSKNNVWNRQHIGPVGFLTENTGINARQVNGILRNEIEYVALSKADALLTAIGEWPLLGNEIPVIPNPKWKMDWWAEHMRQSGVA